jgi:hypothetical protein
VEGGKLLGRWGGPKAVENLREWLVRSYESQRRSQSELQLPPPPPLHFVAQRSRLPREHIGRLAVDLALLREILLTVGWPMRRRGQKD